MLHSLVLVCSNSAIPLSVSEELLRRKVRGRKPKKKAVQEQPQLQQDSAPAPQNNVNTEEVEEEDLPF